MSRRRGHRPALTMSLFPFLAVLICTMGALIVLLVVLVLQARVEATTVEVAEVAPPPALPQMAPVVQMAEQAAKKTKIESNNKRNEAILQQLEQQRKAAIKNLEDQRLRLSGIEDHTLELVEKLQQLRKAIELLEKQKEQEDLNDQDLDKQIALLEKQMKEGEERLEELKDQARNRKPAYALVPFDGINGTSRRPIYIECKKDRVIIQPEGIELYGADFREPLGPGNPLDSALRAIREYRQDQGLGRANPYPLLIVRPGGAESYSAARDAMRSWDSEFGYELISEELVLDYSDSDPFLAKRLVQTIELARRRKVALMMAAPGKYGRAEEFGMVGNARPGSFQGAGGSGSSNPFESNGFVDGGRPLGNASLPGNQALGEFKSQGEVGLEMPSNHPAGQPGTTPGQTANGFYQAQSGDPIAAAISQGTSSQFTENGQFNGNSQQGEANQQNSTAGGNSNQQVANGNQLNSQQNGNSNSLQQGNQFSQSGQSGQSSNAYGAGSSNSMTQPQQGQAGMQMGQLGTGADGSTQAVAASRGRDWALPAKAAIAYSRPIRLQCFANQFVIVPERGSGKPIQTVTVQRTTRQAVDTMVQKIWDRIKSWGIAGPGGYWKPILNVSVEPGGEARFAELQVLMQGSGIELQKVN